jgi:hypothetical protein
MGKIPTPALRATSPIRWERAGVRVGRFMFIRVNPWLKFFPTASFRINPAEQVQNCFDDSDPRWPNTTLSTEKLPGPASSRTA